MKRHSLRGKVTWSLNWRNGWIRIVQVMIRWNTHWTKPYTYFSISYMKAKNV